MKTHEDDLIRRKDALDAIEVAVATNPRDVIIKGLIFAAISTQVKAVVPAKQEHDRKEESPLDKNQVSIDEVLGEIRCE